MKIKRWGETVNTGVKPRASDLLCELSAMAAPYRALHTNECLRSSHRKCSEVCTLACQIGEAGLEDNSSLRRFRWVCIVVCPAVRRPGSHICRNPSTAVNM
jgi:hypothetical protein